MYIFLAFSIIAIFPENRPFDLKQIENWIEFYPIKCPTINKKTDNFIGLVFGELLATED